MFIWLELVFVFEAYAQGLKTLEPLGCKLEFQNGVAYLRLDLLFNLNLFLGLKILLKG